MVELLRHRQTKGAATDMFYLTPPRHISTLHKADLTSGIGDVCSWVQSGLALVYPVLIALTPNWAFTTTRLRKRDLQQA
jgi:hypothetical protein